MKQVKVSVIIPVYNTEKYLNQCLDSVVNQTLKDIEIICVDDGSTDASVDILREYEERDSKVRVIVFEQSQSALEARRQGVQVAKGEYILFLDADDYLEANTCELLYQKASKENVDILQFSSQVENCANLPESRIEMNQKLLTPLERRLTGRAVFTECFVSQKYGFTLWNKLMRTQLCRDAFSKLPQEYLPKAQDLYIYFAISGLAESYLGWKSEPLHHYCLGRGVTANAVLSLDKFHRYCLQSKVVAALESFCRKQGLYDEETEKVIRRLNKQWIWECVQLWLKVATARQEAQATEILFSCWGAREVIAAIAEKYWYSRDFVADRIGRIPGVDLADKNVHTVAIYYYHFTIGGVQRVISLLIPILQGLGCKVVLITDKEPSENDFPLPDGVERVFVQDYQKTTRNNYGTRMDDWERITEEKKIDLVLYNGWTSPLLLWDMMYLKNKGVPVVVQTHSVFSYELLTLGKGFAERPKIFALADGIVTLSETDRRFWRVFNKRVWMLPNPIDPSLLEVPKTDGTAPVITWIGRFSNEKQPWEALNIMKLVVQCYPDAMLYMVGDAANGSILEKYKKMASDSNIENNVRFLGYQNDVSQFLRTAAVNLITSTYEGYPMVLVEALAHGVPTVMYNLPYLELCREEKGVIGVNAGDRQAAANEIVALLKDRAVWEEGHQCTVNAFSELVKFDFAGAWRAVLSGDCPDSGIEPAEAKLIRTITEHYLAGWKYRDRRDQKQPDPPRSEEETICSSWSYRIGRAITFIPRKIRGGIRCYKEHGLSYTWERLQVHLGLKEDPYR